MSSITCNWSHSYLSNHHLTLQKLYTIELPLFSFQAFILKELKQSLPTEIVSHMEIKILRNIPLLHAKVIFMLSLLEVELSSFRENVPNDATGPVSSKKHAFSPPLSLGKDEGAASAFPLLQILAFGFSVMHFPLF